MRHLTLLVAERGDVAAAQAGVRQGAAIAHGMSLAKDLGNLPGNVCTPAYLAQAARDLAKQHKLAVQVLERKDMEKLGMGSLLSVARGSVEPPKLIVLEYRRRTRAAPSLTRWSAKASRSTRAAFRSSPRPRWMK